MDYATLVKLYGSANQANRNPATRYSPGVCIGAVPERISGDPNPALISTSFVERQNLTMRMSMRRFTWLTNGFSKKVENLTAAVSSHFAYYNFVLSGLGVTATLDWRRLCRFQQADEFLDRPDVVSHARGDASTRLSAPPRLPRIGRGGPAFRK